MTIQVEFLVPLETPPSPEEIEDIKDIQKLTEYLDKLVDQLNDYIFNHGKAVQDLQNGILPTLQFISQITPPATPKTGWVAYADGVQWNPGAGEGLYVYKSDNAWHKFA